MSQEPRVEHHGGCHCGRVRYAVAGAFDSAISCNCSICSKKGTLLAFVPTESFRLEKGEEALTDYQFNKHVIDHHFCPTCGCAPFGFGKAPDGTQTAAINIRCLEGIDLGAVKRIPYDGRSV